MSKAGCTRWNARGVASAKRSREHERAAPSQRPHLLKFLVLTGLLLSIASTAEAVIVNGGFLQAKTDTVRDPLHARALVLDDGKTRLAIVVVDSCMMPRELLDRAKELAKKSNRNDKNCPRFWYKSSHSNRIIHL